MGGGRRPFSALVTAVTRLYICVVGGIKEIYTHLGVRMVELLRSTETGRRPRAQSRPAWTPTPGEPAPNQDPPAWKVPLPFLLACMALLAPLASPPLVPRQIQF